MFCTWKQFKLITLYKSNAYWTFTYMRLHFNGFNFDFYNSEVMTSLPHNLVLDSQPRFGLTKSEFLNLYNFLINQRIFIKFVAKCLSLQSPTSEFKDNFCNPIPLRR